jgi:hypothetical protein
MRTRFTSLLKWLVVAAVLVLLVTSGSSSPVHVQEADAASYSHQLYSQWRMDEPSDLGGLFGVKAAVTWSTSDPSAACYDSRRGTGASGISQADAIDYPFAKCGSYGTPYPWLHEYPLAVSDYTCWVSKSWVVTVQIDSCGPVPSWWNSAPYYQTIGVHFRTCIGIINTPFSICESYASLLHLGGSEVWVQYQGG